MSNTRYVGFKEHLDVSSETPANLADLEEVVSLASSVDSSLSDLAAMISPISPEFQAIFPNFTYYEEPDLSVVPNSLVLDPSEFGTNPYLVQTQQAFLDSTPFDMGLKARCSTKQDISSVKDIMTYQIGSIALQSGKFVDFPAEAFVVNQTPIDNLLKFSTNLKSNVLVSPLDNLVDSVFTDYLDKFVGKKSELLELNMQFTNKINSIIGTFALPSLKVPSMPLVNFNSVFKLQKSMLNFDIKVFTKQESLVMDMFLEHKVPNLDWLKPPLPLAMLGIK